MEDLLTAACASASSRDFQLLQDEQREELLKFLVHRITVDLLREQLEMLLEIPLSEDAVLSELKQMCVYFTPARFSVVRGWCVTDGVVLVGGNLAPSIPWKHQADLYTVSLLETAHFLACRLAKDFSFCSPKSKFGLQFHSDPRGPEKKLAF